MSFGALAAGPTFPHGSAFHFKHLQLDAVFKLSRLIVVDKEALRQMEQQLETVVDKQKLGLS